MSKKWIYPDGNSADKIIDLIRELGGTIFVDPYPRSPIEKRLHRFLMKTFKKQ